MLSVEFESNSYPAGHWRQLKRFAVGSERDPRGMFRLADDKWEAWPYALNGTPSTARSYRFHFTRFRSFLKFYAKWFCYQLLVGKGRNLRLGLPRLPSTLLHTDRYIREHGFRSVDDIAAATVFQSLWDAQIQEPYQNITPRPQSAVCRQELTRAFWRSMKMEFGVPFVVPPVAPCVKRKPAEFADDASKLIPDHVIMRLTNRLGLHRDEKEPLSRFDHLRLCVLMLLICLGRRVSEILLSRRGEGRDGPLSRYPSKGGPPEGSLWFKFLPNKDGPADKVYISAVWEEFALYCVRELVKYGDEIRHLAAPEERGQLILVSPANATRGHYTDAGGAAAEKASGLTYVSFTHWLNGTKETKGIFAKWGITADGSEGGPTYRFLTSYSRHTRQSAIAVDERVPLLARQRDLNHRDPNVQFAYQHRLRENNNSLLEKLKEGKLVGRGVEWLSVLLDVELKAAAPPPSFERGRPSPMTPRMWALVRNSPLFLQRNRVPCGFCVLPQGPGGCAEYMNCTCAGEGGCHSFMIDTGDALMLNELNTRADEQRRLQQESASAGRVVQAQKRGVLASRTEDLRDEAMRAASEEVLVALRRLQGRIEEEGL
jgi:integrase